MPATAAATATAAAVPQFDHVVIVMFENKNYSTIKGGSSAPYLNSLASQGTLFTNSFGVTHPSQPNYIALFSGSQQGVTNDDCPKTLGGGNLGSSLAFGLAWTNWGSTAATGAAAVAAAMAATATAALLTGRARAGAAA
ncbi:alkaline phosphatase family protein [Nonomuraea sp. NPDC052265]|uniref:alkaline phosphatase family protein n=1 Tax=Nonomuraea sp. NPDC052265 TaxID=3364374 RepID=UPI0037C68124